MISVLEDVNIINGGTMDNYLGDEQICQQAFWNCAKPTAKQSTPTSNTVSSTTKPWPIEKAARAVWK